MFSIGGMTFDEAGPPEEEPKPEEPKPFVPVKGAFPPTYVGDDDWFFAADDFDG